MSALYGLHPARFEPRHKSDRNPYEEVEIPWLLAVWPSFMGRLTEDGEVFSLTKGGQPTGWLLMSEEVTYPYRTAEDEIADVLADEIRKEIDREILATLQQTFTPGPIRPPAILSMKPPMVQPIALEERLRTLGVTAQQGKHLFDRWMIEQRKNRSI